MKPDIIYTHFFEDDHLDHICYESPSARASFFPNYFVDIPGYIDKKVKALAMHKTQREKLYIWRDK